MEMELYLNRVVVLAFTMQFAWTFCQAGKQSKMRVMTRLPLAVFLVLLPEYND